VYLRSLEIRNFRSLEHVKLDRLSQFNVLIGRNNAGKSSAFVAIQAVNYCVNGSQFSWDRVITHQESQRAVQVELGFTLTDDERREFISLLISPSSQSRIDQVFYGQFARHITFLFRSASGHGATLNLCHTQLTGEDGHLMSVQRLNDDQLMSPLPSGEVAHLADIANRSVLNADTVTVTKQVPKVSLPHERGSFHNFFSGNPSGWPQRMLARWLNSAFFFSPFRHSTAVMTVEQTPTLTQDGSNLSRALHTINSNNRNKFQQIEHFVQAALPDVGTLQTPIEGTSTYIAFRSKRVDSLTRVHEMGGGVEQLLMAATVLLTTGDESSVFLEEPESHLHPGAQRYLIEKLLGTGRQVFLTTHSPTFVNVTGERSLYQVTMSNGQTGIRRVEEVDSLADALEDIGLRNSDVLLSDGVVFVEGEGDREALVAWSKTLGKDLLERNVTVRLVGGGASQGVKAGSAALKAVSDRSDAIPHLFVLDRDERSETEIAALTSQLGERVHILDQRELENYLLSPAAIRAVLLDKASTNQPIRQSIEATDDTVIQHIIDDAAEHLRGAVLLKRVRNEVGWVGDMQVREMFDSLASESASMTLPQQIRGVAQTWIDEKFSEDKVAAVIAEQRSRLEVEWAQPGGPLRIAPGSEILDAVFQHFGLRYRKRDAGRLAEVMLVQDIADEVRMLVEQASGLPTRERL
jgi:predicted ATPase